MPNIQDEVNWLAQQARQAVKDPKRPNLPSGTNDVEIDAFETRIGVSVPPELRAWLKFSNGPRIGRGGVFGIRTPDSFDDIETVWLPDWPKRGWFPIASDGCGSDFVLTTRAADGPGRPVFFLDHERRWEYLSTPTYVFGSELWHLLRFYLRDALVEPSWPYDRAKVLADDPALANVTKVPRPWEVD